MAKEKNTISLPPITKGMISNISHYSAPADSWSYLENFDCDTLGELTSRENIVRGFQTFNRLSGLFVRSFTASPNSLAYYLKYDDLIYQGGFATSTYSALPSITGLDITAFARFSSIGDYTFICVINKPFYYIKNSDTYINSFTMGPNSNGCYLINAGFQGRIWGVSVSFPNRIYYTDLVPLDLDTNAPTGGGANYIELNTKGKSITALVESDNVLYVYTTDGVFRVYNTQNYDNTPFTSVGTFRQESVTIKDGIQYFINEYGIFRLKGNETQKISISINDIFKKISPKYTALGFEYTKEVFCWYIKDSVLFYIGSFKDVDKSYIIKYNIDNQSFSLQSIYKWAMTGVFTFNGSNTNTGYLTTPINFFSFSNGNTGVDNNMLAYDVDFSIDEEERPFLALNSNRKVYNGDFSQAFNLSDSQNSISKSQPIFCTAETHWLNFEKEYVDKEINGLAIASENAKGFKIYYQVDKEDNQVNSVGNSVWTEIGEISDDFVTLFRNFKVDNFKRIKFKISGNSLGNPVKIGQLTFLDVQEKGYARN